jgi:ubiquitin carboxyl-terminal hydrolase 10
VKPAINSKPPVKSWSELLNESNHASNNSSFITISSGSSSTCSSRPTSAISLEVDFEGLKVSTSELGQIGVLDMEFLGKPVIGTVLQSRPIINPGNRCYMIAVLQVLLHTKSFSNYMEKYFFKMELLPSVLSTGKFPLLEALKLFYNEFKIKETTTGAVSHEFIDEIFMALKDKNGSFSSAGFAEQEDAEEFLTAFLDALADEFIGIQSQKLLNFSLPFEKVNNGVNILGNGVVHKNSHFIIDDNDNDDDWLQVGPKQRVATTRRTPLSQSPIHLLFAGNFQSLYKSPGARPSITFEPFTVLSLSLIREKNYLPIETVNGAIEHVLRLEDLGKKCTKQLSFSSLPPILIIQLKRFIYKQNSSTKQLELHKITRPLRIPLELILSQNNSSFNYKIYGLVNHHGSSLNSGHYTSIIRTTNDSWSSFDDDTNIQSVNNNIETILNQNSSSYLLFYERTV